MIEYIVRASKDDTLLIDITSGEFKDIRIRYFNMDFSGLDIDGECFYDYEMLLAEEREFTDEENIRLGHTLDDILSDVINSALQHALNENTIQGE